MGGKEIKQNEYNLQPLQPAPHPERERHVLIHQRTFLRPRSKPAR